MILNLKKNLKNNSSEFLRMFWNSKDDSDNLNAIAVYKTGSVSDLLSLV